MNEDDFAAAVADLDEFIPGSRHRRTQAPERPAAAGTYAAVSWDSRPYIKHASGKAIELFAIGALAAALNRPLVTIRLWTRQGRLPQALYRLPTRQVPVYGPDGKVNGHKEQKGRRLYTRAQIEAVIRIAGEHNILHTKRIDWDQHKDFGLQVADAWQRLANEGEL